MSGTLQAQVPAKRCDWVADSIPGSSGGGKACIDIMALSAGNVTITLPSNTTRIGTEGLELCRNAFSETVGGGADVVFIADQSGSMWSSHISGSGATATYFYNTGGCNSTATTGNSTYSVLDDRPTRPGNTTRTVANLNSLNGCNSYAGDPFNARAKLFRQAIDYMASTSPTSTAGYVGFAGSTMHPRPPLQLNSAANVQTVKDSMYLDSAGSTNYENPLRLAYTWFGNASLMKTGKKAIVFLSDGAPNAGDHQAALDVNIPVYSIYLGHASAPVGELQTLSTRSGGLFFRVNPNDTTAMRTVMDSIIRTINTTALPQSVTIRNGSTTPPQLSTADNITFNTEGNVSLSLDSIIGLRQGANAIQISVNYGDSSRNYNLTVNATGAVAGGTNSTVTCYDQPTLVMLRNGTILDSIYPPGNSNYTIRLVRPTSELGSITINAVSKDSIIGSTYGDSELVVLNQQSGGGTYQIAGYPVDGSNPNPTDRNGTLESDLDGNLILTWTNPRDSRETARYELPGRKIVSLVDVVVINRLTRYGGGVDISGGISDPVVLRSGVVYTNTGGNLVVTNKGNCISNCGDVPRILTEGLTLPSFEFKTMAPFSYSIYLYDHLGQFVRTATGKVDNAIWQGLTKDPTGAVPIVMTVIPIAQDGRQCGTGVYILKATIRTETVVTTDSLNNQVRVVGTSKRMIKQFGYLREGR